MISRSIQNLIGSDRRIIAFLINFFLNLVINFFDDFLNLPIIILNHLINFFKPFHIFFILQSLEKKSTKFATSKKVTIENSREFHI